MHEDSSTRTKGYLAMILSISDTFTSYQGTGSLMGQLQFFVRTQGCSVKCPIRHLCDEPHALDVVGGKSMSVSEIVSDAIDAVGVGGWIHITGGEPLDNLEGWKLLVSESMAAGLRVQTQTSGMIDHGMPIGRSGRVTVSPKGSLDSLKVRHGTELVLVAAPWVSRERAAEFIDSTAFDYYYIAPVHLGGNKWDTNRAADLIEYLSSVGQTGWRLTHQIHKLYGVR